MEVTKQRKACDLCYRRKIKCDGSDPRCSNCKIYKSECTYIAASRKKKKRSTAAAKDTIDAAAPDALSSSQLQILEAQLKVALEENRALRKPMRNVSHKPDHSLVESRGSEVVTRGHCLELPPKDIVQSLIQDYLSTFNCFLPLFDSRTLYNTVHNWYHNPTQRSPTAWASIYVAMALAQYQGNQPQHPQISVADCLRRAQTVLSDLIMGDAELSGVQVVLGLVLLFIGTPDPRPSSVLIATAIKLVHAMSLHRQEGYLGLPPSEVLQRQRVFWIAYILDRDISLRTRQPPSQHDLEVDVELPSETNDPSGSDFVTAPWSNQTFNYFRCRAQLARIQGEVYDCLYSVGAQQMSLTTMATRATQLQQSIEEWHSMIPPDFSAEVLSHDSVTVLPQYFCQLYSAYVSCLGQLCRATSMDLPWVEALLSHSRKMSLGELCEAPKVPEGWGTLVNASRSMMNLFTSVQHKEAAFVWTNICTYSSGLVCLTANSVLQLKSTFPELDQDLKDNAMVFIDQLTQQSNHEGLKRVSLACAELNGRTISMDHRLASHYYAVAT